MISNGEIKIAGKRFERQERSFIDIVRNSNCTTIKAGNNILYNVKGAFKNEERTLTNKNESYTDVVIETKDKSYKISMKGKSSPSIAGGGRKGIEQLLPGYINKFLRQCYEYYVENYSNLSIVPDLYFQIEKRHQMRLLQGTEEIGGPIDFLYIGPMNVTCSRKMNMLQLNGKLIACEEFVKRNNLYMRLRKRRSDQVFDNTLFDSSNIPVIFSKSKMGDTGARVVITNKLTKNGILL